MNKRACSNYDIKKKTKFITNEEMIKKGGSRYFNLINQYIASVSAVSKQPHRPNNQKNRYMTINAKKVKDIYKQRIPIFAEPYYFMGIYTLPYIESEWPESIERKNVKFDLIEILKKSTN